MNEMHNERLRHHAGRHEDDVATDDKERCTLRLSRDLMDKLRDAVYWTPGLTLGSLAEQALRTCIDEIEAGRGGPFPPRAGNLKTGRPVKA